jgi:hypothetical protein
MFVAPRPGPPQNPAHTLAIDETIPKQIFRLQEIFDESDVEGRDVKLWRQLLQ